MALTDLRCNHPTCNNRDIYRMIGLCSNCGTTDVMMLFTVEHDSIGTHQCPVCGCRQLRSQRLATADELPIDFEAVQMASHIDDSSTR